MRELPCDDASYANTCRFRSRSALRAADHRDQQTAAEQALGHALGVLDA